MKHEKKIIDYGKPAGLTLRKKIANRSESIIEDDYCYLHEDSPYIVIDASYVFNRCSHDYYWNNLVVTACKLRLLNTSASQGMITDGLKFIMAQAQRSVYYPTVLIEEAKSIVSHAFLYSESALDYVHEMVHGFTTEEINAMSQSNQFTVVYDERTIEWKPSVVKLFEFSKEEELELESLWRSGDEVAHYRFLQQLKLSKKISHTSNIIAKSKQSRIDMIVHNTASSIFKNTGDKTIPKDVLYKHVINSHPEISLYMFTESVKRLRTSVVYGTSIGSDIVTSQEYMVAESEEKIMKAGYEIHNENKLINKNRVREKSGVSSRTVQKRWDSVAPTFSVLNQKLTGIYQ